MNPQSHTDILVVLKMLDAGIVPYTWPRDSLEEGLGSMSPVEARKARRKFRKLWRKALQNYTTDHTAHVNLKRLCGVGLPTAELEPRHHLERARLVYKMLEKQI